MSVKIHKRFTHNRYNFAQFIGFYSAHMVWNLEGGDNVIPLLAIQKASKSWFERFEAGCYKQAVSKGLQRFETVPLYKNDGVLLAYDGYLTQGEERKESLFIAAFENRDPAGIAYLLTIPYRSARSAEGLAIDQPKIFLPEDSSDFSTDLFLNHLKEGVFSHTEGTKFWNNHRDRHSAPILIAEVKQNKLLGTWIRDPEDTESIRRFGDVKLHFTADGRLIYIILGEEKDQIIFLTYRVEGNALITDQPSHPREERTKFRITEDGKLEQECSDGGTARYIHTRFPEHLLF